MLRHSPPGSFTLVGSCYLAGVNDGASLLGPLHNWRTESDRFARAGSVGGSVRYRHLVTQEVSLDNPHLAPLPDPWTAEITKTESGDWISGFKNEETGLVQYHDPRMEPEVLRKHPDLEVLTLH